jgi:hypothetical protein
VLETGPLQEQDMTSDERWKIEDAYRYNYFIRVDTEAMESVLEGDRGWVNLVQVGWPGDDDDAENIASDDGHPPLEGITTYNVRFQRVSVDLLYPFCWTDLLYNAHNVLVWLDRLKSVTRLVGRRDDFNIQPHSSAARYKPFDI